MCGLFLLQFYDMVFSFLSECEAVQINVKEIRNIGYTRRGKTKQKYTIQRNWQHRVHKTGKNKAKIYNTEKLATQGTQDGEKQSKNIQYRETGNIGYTRRGKTKQKAQHNMCQTLLYDIRKQTQIT